MSYMRVIPRDLFNEASLLKCYGKLYLETEGNPNATFGDVDFESFDIEQNIDGDLFIDNLPFRIQGKHYRLKRPLNSRQPWPLYAEDIDDPDFESVAVFNVDGTLSVEFQALIQGVDQLC